jgi:hypothetical protein
VVVQRAAPRASSASAPWADSWDDSDGSYDGGAPWPDGSAAPRGAPWERLEGCDVLLPPDEVEVRGIVHFVGGALVGVVPRQAYGPFLEGLAAAGYAVIATPDPQLLGLDHGAAARSVAERYADAARSIYERYSISDRRVPVFGLGHSLGAKVLILAGCDSRARRALGARRCANVLVAYNNYSARRSVPLFEPLIGALRTGLAQTGVLTDAALDLVKALDDAADQVGRGSDVATPFRQGLRELGRLSGQIGAAVQGVKISDDFTPGPAETLAAVRAAYAVSSNLVLRFDGDTICESERLARELRARFTDKVTGVGGRLAYKRLRGTHVTPNTPDLSAGLSADAGPAAAQALENARAELDALIDTVVVFLDKEAAGWVSEPQETDTYTDGSTGRIRGAYDKLPYA